MKKSIESILQELADCMYWVAKYTDSDLSNLGKYGIFTVPELAYAFLVGREAMRDRQSIFGTQRVDWIRESSDGKGTPIDLCFGLPEQDFKIYVEFKMVAKQGDYLADIQKLSKLSTDSSAALFCVLADPFRAKIPDLRLSALGEPDNVNEIVRRSFPTASNSMSYKGDQNCEVAIYRVQSSL